MTYKFSKGHAMNDKNASATQVQHAMPRVAARNSRISQIYRGLLASLGFVALLFVVPATVLAGVAVAPILGTAADFGALGNSGVVGSAGAGTVVNGNVGSAPTTPTITNFPPSSVSAPFVLYTAADPVTAQAHTDANIAYTFLQSQVAGDTPLGNNLSGLTLTPGLYSSGAADLGASTTLTLNDPSPDKTGIFVFNIASTLTMNGSSVVTGTADPCNVYWRVGSSATLNGTSFMGTIIADTSITVSSASSVSGRLLAGAVTGTGVVTMAVGGNLIGGCSPAKLVLQKTVIGGTALASDFTLTATGNQATPTVISGTTPTLAANAPKGVYTLSETGPAGYTAEFSCSGGGSLTGNQLTVGAADSGNTITCTITNTVIPPLATTITVTKVSNGGVGTFNFTGNNGFANQSIITATSGVGVTGTTQALTTAGVSTTITESAPPAGFTLASIDCTGLGAGGTQVPNIGTRSVTLDAAATAAGSAIACTFTNTFGAPVLPTITVTKVSNGGVGTFNFIGNNGFANQSITTATTGVGMSGATQTLTTAGVSTTITESAPPAGFTLASIDCTGLGAGGTQVPNIGTRSVTLDAAATAAGSAIACTFTNTFGVIPPIVTPAASIPTLSEWAMIMLVALLAMTGFVAMRRQV